ncbi:MAG TPA: hypothetical protein VFF06_10310 [Polyangia bacterium]|nr:hypothetical protein [Polyangia bacterium]
MRAHDEVIGTTQEEAFRLTADAVRQAQRALVGVFAIPASISLGAAATMLLVAAFAEQGLELFRVSIDSVMRGARDLSRDVERAIPRLNVQPQPGGDPSRAHS